MYQDENKCTHKGDSINLRSEGVDLIEVLANGNKILKIDICDSISKESFKSGIYQKPYWIIEFEINKAAVNSNVDRNRTVAYITTRNITKRKAVETVDAQTSVIPYATEIIRPCYGMHAWVMRVRQLFERTTKENARD